MCFSTQLQMGFSAMHARWNARIHDEMRVKLQHYPYWHVSAFVRPVYPILCSDLPHDFVVGRWGLIPPTIANGEENAFLRKHITYNAKSERAFSSPIFQSAVQKRRCIVPVTGFFEWMRIGKKTYPHFIRMNDESPFSLAGCWERHVEDGQDERTYTILTTEANPLMARIHNTKKRMPLILPKEREHDWLNESLSVAEVKDLFVPFSDEHMHASLISRMITDKKQDANVPEVISAAVYPELDLA